MTDEVSAVRPAGRRLRFRCVRRRSSRCDRADGRARRGPHRLLDGRWRGGAILLSPWRPQRDEGRARRRNRLLSVEDREQPDRHGERRIRCHEAGRPRRSQSLSWPASSPMCSSTPSDLRPTVTKDMLDSALAMAMQASLAATVGCIEAFSTTDFRTELASIRVPTLVLHGTADIAVSFERARRPPPASPDRD